jgi:hypothetical protein
MIQEGRDAKDLRWYHTLQVKFYLLALWSCTHIPNIIDAPTYQISLTYLERQKCYGPDKKILFKLEAV